MRLLFFLLFIVVNGVITEVDFDLPKSAIKKIDKTLLTYFSDKKVKTTALYLTKEDAEKISFTLKRNKLFKIQSNENLEGYLYLGAAKSKFDTFDYMVLFKPDLTILTAKVLLYREDYGGEITSKRWLKQFDDKSNGLEMELGNDIQIISGATISCRSITLGIKKLSKNIQEMATKGVLH